MGLEAILDWNMNDLEAKAYKLCLIWEKTIARELPNYHTAKLPQKGDPRKSVLFRYCYKLARETQGLIPDTDYKLYIFAQIYTLKNISDGTVHALIEPACLVGDKAWYRWKYWKNQFEKFKQKQLNQGDTSQLSASETHVLNELRKTKEFLSKQIDNLNYHAMEALINSPDFIKWVSFSKVSPYYLIISPIVKNIIPDLDKVFAVEESLYLKSINNNIIIEFKKMFEHEFSKC